MNPLHVIRRLVLDGYGYRYLIGSRLAARKLKKLARTSNFETQKLVDVVFNFSFRPTIAKRWEINIKPLQSKIEIVNLCNIVKKLNPQSIVEIGTAGGGTLFLWANVSEAKNIISIDLPGGAFGGSYPVWKIPLYKSMGRKNTIRLIRANSHEDKTFLRLKEFLNGQSIDFLFIDGDHTYDGVKQDFERYAPLVRKGGIVAFHDIVTHDPEINCHVDKFWSEVKQRFKSDELIENKSQKFAGIGILYV
jgi:predicted O-methyltransferase YrrM